MSKARLVITAVVVEGRSQAEVARAYGMSKGWVSKLMARYRAEGEAAYEPRSRRPHTSPTALEPSTVELIVAARKHLTERGLDAGPDTIRWHLQHTHEVTVSRATIARHLTAQGLVVAEPAKRPRSSYIRFAAEHPTNAGKPTSPITGSPTPTAGPAPTSKSCAGSTTTSATPSGSPLTGASPAPPCCTCSAKPLPNTGSRRPR